MAIAPPTVCSKPGCTRTVAGGKRRCPLHPYEPRTRNGGDVRYDERRGSAKARGYDRDWKRLRDAYLSGHPLCEDCEARGRVVGATEVDHKIPITRAPELRLEESNLRALCHPCHMRKTALERNRR